MNDVSVTVTTVNSFRAGIEDNEPFECHACKQKTMYLDWVGCRCDTCGADTAWDGDLGGEIKSIRSRAKISRKKIAEESGLSVATIRKYENLSPSKKFRQWFYGFIEQHYAT